MYSTYSQGSIMYELPLKCSKCQVFGGLRQENCHEFKAILDYIARSWLKNKTKPVSTVVDTTRMNALFLGAWLAVFLVFIASYAITKSQSLHHRRGSGEANADYQSAFTECLLAANQNCRRAGELPWVHWLWYNVSDICTLANIELDIKGKPNESADIRFNKVERAI